MRAARVVVSHPVLENPSQVIFRQGNDAVQSFAPEGPQDPLTDGIGLWTVRRCLQHTQGQGAYAPVQGLGEDAVAVMEQEAIVMI
jgi:hypothetical protein